MIFDNIKNAHNYYSTHPEFPKVFEELQKIFSEKNYEDKTISISGSSKVMVQNGLILRNTGRFEYHFEYMDIHFCIKGKEKIEYAFMPKGEAEAVGNDIILIDGVYAGEVILSEGDFVIFFTGEYHKPQLGKKGDLMSKCLVKIKE